MVKVKLIINISAVALFDNFLLNSCIFEIHYPLTVYLTSSQANFQETHIPVSTTLPAKI